VTMDYSWKTPELRDAEANLRAAVDHGRETIVATRRFKAGLRPAGRLSDEDVAAIERAAGASDAPPELRALAERVARGDLTWRAIVDGEALDDPDVKAAMAVNLERMGQVYEKFAEGHTLEDVLESESPRPRPRRDDWGDDGEGAGPTVLKHDAW
jgi:hypothetical protein